MQETKNVLSTKRVICPICEHQIKVGELSVIEEGYCGYSRTYHKDCIENLVKNASPLTESDVEEYGTDDEFELENEENEN